VDNVSQPVTRRLRSHRRHQFGKLRALVASLGVATLALITFASWGVGSSVGSAPDDQVHMASIWCSGFAGETCEVIEETGERLIPSGLKEAMCTTQNPFQSAGCQPLLNLKDPPMISTRDVNTVTGAYPAGFYMTMNLLVQDDIERAITSMRIANGIIFVGLIMALWWLLPNRLRQPLTWSWLLTLTPLGFFLIASVNPSSWAIMSVGFGWLAAMGFLESSRRGKAVGLAAVYFVTALMAFSSRTDSAVFFVLTSALAVFLSPIELKPLLVRLWLPLVPALVALGNVVFRGANNVGQLGVIEEGFGSRKVSRYGEPLPWAKGANPEPTGEFDWNLLWNNIWDAPALWLGFVGGYPFGSLGWLDTLLPQFIPFTLMFVISAVAFTGIQGANWRKKTAIIGMIVGAWFLPVYLLQLGGFIVGEEFQPRYLLPIFTVLVAVTLLREQKDAPIYWGRFRLWALWLPLVIAHSIALHTGMRRYTTGFGLGGLDLDYMREWWWLFMPGFLNATTVWAIGSVAFALVSALIIHSNRVTFSPEAWASENPLEHQRVRAEGEPHSNP
jgi:hypothetical protein